MLQKLLFDVSFVELLELGGSGGEIMFRLLVIVSTPSKGILFCIPLLKINKKSNR